VATILTISLRIKLPNVVQFKHYSGKSRPCIPLFKQWTSAGKIINFVEFQVLKHRYYCK